MKTEVSEDKRANNRKKGTLGESAAELVYNEAGFLTVCKNWHYKRFGELDLVLEKPAEKLLSVCEVKLRKNSAVAPASAAVNGKKQATIRFLAACFLAENPRFRDYNVRFDVAEVYSGENNRVNIIEGAF